MEFYNLKPTSVNHVPEEGEVDGLGRILLLTTAEDAETLHVRVAARGDAMLEI